MDEERIIGGLKVLSRLKIRPSAFVHLRQKVNAHLHSSSKNVWLPPLYHLRPYFTLTIVIVLLVMIGGGATIAAAQVVNPGHKLYEIKLASEQFAEALTPSAAKRIHLSTGFAERRAEELAVLKLRVAGEINHEKTEVKNAIAKTAARLGEASKKVQRQIIGMQSESPKMHRAVNNVSRKVAVFTEALQGASEITQSSPEFKEAIEDAQIQVEVLKRTVELVSLPNGEAASGNDVRIAFDKVKILKAAIERETDEFTFKGILVTTEIKNSIRVMDALMKEARLYAKRDQHSEAHGLAQSAERMGEQILEQLQNRERSILMLR